MKYCRLSRWTVLLAFVAAIALPSAATADADDPVRLSEESPTRGETTVVEPTGEAEMAALTITYFPASEVSIESSHEVPPSGTFAWTPEHAGLVSLEYSDLAGETTGALVVSVRYATLPLGALVILALALTALAGSFIFALVRMRER